MTNAAAIPRRILLVDDEEDMLEWLELVVASPSCVAEATSDPFDALERIRRARFDLVVSDIRMPGLSGLQLVSEATSIQPDIKFVLISGQIAECDTAGQNIAAFLAKPFRAKPLLEAIQNALKGRTC